jgi:hypothetical protein
MVRRVTQGFVFLCELAVLAGEADEGKCIFLIFHPLHLFFSYDGTASRLMNAFEGRSWDLINQAERMGWIVTCLWLSGNEKFCDDEDIVQNFLVWCTLESL